MKIIFDLLILLAPDFVSTLEDNDHVYFFFRESAVEHINCGKVSFSCIENNAYLDFISILNISKVLFNILHLIPLFE